MARPRAASFTFGEEGAPSYREIGARAKLGLENIGAVAFVPVNSDAARWRSRAHVSGR